MSSPFSLGGRLVLLGTMGGSPGTVGPLGMMSGMVLSGVALRWIGMVDEKAVPVRDGRGGEEKRRCTPSFIGTLAYGKTRYDWANPKQQTVRESLR
jgi:hypothetical protein